MPRKYKNTDIYIKHGKQKNFKRVLLIKLIVKGICKAGIYIHGQLFLPPKTAVRF